MKLVVTPADVVRVVREQAEALASLPESIAALNRAVLSLAQTISRLDRLVQRLDRVTEPLEAPLAALAPKLEALLPLLDEEVLAGLPEVLKAIQRDALPALHMVGQTQAQVAAIAGSLDRLIRLVDDTVARFGDMPGARLITRMRGAPPSGTGPRSGV